MKKLLVLVLAIGMIFSFCACGADKNGPTGNEPIDSQTQNDTEKSSNEETVSKFKVTLVDQDGNPVPNAMVQICNDENCLMPLPTDENGIVEFNFETSDGHKLVLSPCPDGYETEHVGENYAYIDDGETEYTFEITKK